MDYTKKTDPFSRATLSDAIRIWGRASLSLIDIRHNLISPDGVLRNYRLPASAFLYTSGGKAEVLMNDTAYSVERFGLFHGGKGTELTILPHCEWLEYYMVLYKATEPSLRRAEYARLMEQGNPFRQQYGFTPDHPLFFSEELRKMYERWRGPTPLNLFYGKAAFYRFVYEVYEELERGHVRVLEPDVIAMARRFLDEHYREPVSINDLCGLLGISYSHFHRSFKQRTGKSPQEYLISARLAAARSFLQNSHASIREIADFCGFQDERNLQRMFSKNLGITPNAYRENMSHHLRDDVLGMPVPFPYNGESKVSFDELKGKGATNMFKQIRSQAVVAAALSMVLLMSACGAVPSNSDGASSTSTLAVTGQVTETEAAEPVQEGTRIVHTVMGDVEVPSNPKRIVTSGFWVGDILALGKHPIAIQDFYVTTSAWSEQAKNITVLEKWEPEYIMDLEPDLIITGTFGRNKPDDYDDLSRIAPTVAFDWNEEPEERLPVMAQALGLDAAAGEALVNEYNQKIEDYRKRLEDAGVLDKTITVFRNDGLVEGGLELGSDIGWGGEVVYALYGMPMPEEVKALHSKEDASGKVSFEVVPKLCGDYILMNQSDPALIKQLNENPIWQSIPAVQRGNILVVEPGKVYFPDIITDTYKLEVISEALLALAAES